MVDEHAEATERYVRKHYVDEFEGIIEDLQEARTDIEKIITGNELPSTVVNKVVRDKYTLQYLEKAKVAAANAEIAVRNALRRISIKEVEGHGDSGPDNRERKETQTEGGQDRPPNTP